MALARVSIDLDACEIRIIETTAEPDSGGLIADIPKSRAGRRTVAFPAEFVPELRWHLERFAQPGDRATRDRDQVIAKALGGLARQARILDQDQADNG